MSQAKQLGCFDQQRAAGPNARAEDAGEHQSGAELWLQPGTGGFGDADGLPSRRDCSVHTTAGLIHGALSLKHSHCPSPWGFTARSQEIQHVQPPHIGGDGAVQSWTTPCSSLVPPVGDREV